MCQPRNVPMWSHHFGVTGALGKRQTPPLSDDTPQLSTEPLETGSPPRKVQRVTVIEAVVPNRSAAVADSDKSATKDFCPFANLANLLVRSLVIQETAESTLDTLRALGLERPSNRVACSGLAKTEISQNLVIAVEDNASNPRLLWKACSLMHVLIDACPDVFKDQFESAGQRVVAAMRRFPLDLLLQRHGSSALYSTAFGGGLEPRVPLSPIFAKSAIQVTVNAMNEYPHDQDLQENCCKFLFRLCGRQSPSYCDLILERDGVSTILGAIRDNKDNRTVLLFGALCLERWLSQPPGAGLATAYKDEATATLLEARQRWSQEDNQSPEEDRSRLLQPIDKALEVLGEC